MIKGTKLGEGAHQAILPRALRLIRSARRHSDTRTFFKQVVGKRGKAEIAFFALRCEKLHGWNFSKYPLADTRVVGLNVGMVR